MGEKMGERNVWRESSKEKVARIDEDKALESEEMSVRRAIMDGMNKKWNSCD